MSILDFFPFNEIRPQQKKILLDIESNWSKYKYFAFNAATGIGKSAIAMTVSEFTENSFITCPLKSLQRQYMRDIDNMRSEGNPHAIKYHYLMGKSNYPCIRDSYNMCDSCIHVTGKSGETISKCPMRSECTYQIEKAETIRAPIAVVNNHVLWFCKFKTRDLLVIDEAHRIEEFLMNTVSVNFTPDSCIRDRMVNSKMKQSEMVPIVAEQFIKLKEEYDETIGTIEELSGHEPNSTEIARLSKRIFTVETKMSIMQSISENYLEFFPEPDLKINKMIIKPIKAHKWAHKLLHQGNKVLLLSATLPNKEQFCRQYNIPEEEMFYSNEFEFPIFPINNRVVIMDTKTPNLKGMFKKTKEEKENIMKRQVMIFDKLFEKLSREKECKALVITHTNDIMSSFFTYSKYKNIMIECSSRKILKNEEDSENGLESVVPQQAVETHKKRTGNSILIGPQLYEGLDLPEHRLIVMCKVPKQPWTDRVACREHEDPGWYESETVLKIIQGPGRVFRGPKDKAAILLLDRDFEVYWGKSRIQKHFPSINFWTL